jgi:class 3 adenylate cyclase
MSLADDLTAEVVKILKEQWTVRQGRQVPDTPDLKLANDAVTLSGTVLYADLADSTGLVASSKAAFAAEVYKSYLNCACRIITANGGTITAFDGDRVMAVYLGESKNTDAMKSALQINHAVLDIINPKIRETYPYTPSGFSVRQAVGVDTSDLFVARTGIRGSNDLVWVGNAAWISAAVYDGAADSVKLGGQNNSQQMWERRSWTARGGATVYASKWKWKP